MAAAVIAAGCAGGAPTGAQGTAPAATPAPAPAAEPAPVTEPEAMAQADSGADAEATPAPPGARGQTRVLDVTQVPSEQSAFDGQYGVHPCDFDRFYRGHIGKTALSVMVTPATGLQGDGRFVGQAHYDRAGPSLPIVAGNAKGGAVRFSEKGGGSFDGSCDAATGRIAGTYTLKGKTQSFELWPRPAQWPPMYRVLRHKTVAANFPGCAKVQKRDQVTSAPIPGDDYGEAVCPPTDPKARREAIDSGAASCEASDFGLRVFAIPHAAAINHALETASPYASALGEIKKCWSVHSHGSTQWLMHASADLLTVQSFNSEDWGGAHPMNSTGGGTAIDLRRGRVIRLGDVITNTDKLRDIAKSCAWDYFAVEGTQEKGRVAAYPPSYPGGCDEDPVSHLMWDCDPKDKQKLGPRWGLFDEGVGILASGYGHAMAALEGRGPIISWAALARTGILKKGSPVAHLWSSAKAAPDGAPTCTSAFSGEPTLVRWTVVQRGE
jgi:hypothetical protein